MKKIIAIILSVICVLAAAGCNGGKQSGKKETADLTEIHIAKTVYHQELDAWNDDDEYGEELRRIFAEIEGECNIKITVDYYQPTEFVNTARAAITGGDTSFADIMISQLFTVGPMYAQELLYNLSEMSGLDINSDLWNKELTNVATFKNGSYGIGNAGLTGADGMAMYYNKTLLKTLGIEDPMKYVENGTWTWDKLRELALKAVKDTNNDGKFTDEDRYGCTSASYDGLVAAFLTCGIKTIVKDSSGNLVYNLLGDDATKAFQKFKSTYSVNDGMFYAAGLDNSLQQHQFLSGKCLFMLGGWTNDEEPADDVEICVLPLPKYTADQEYSSPCFHNNSIIMVPANVENPELVGKVITLLGEKTKNLGKSLIEDASVDFSDREKYVDTVTKYISGKLTVDPCTIMINSNESISIGTMRAIATPIFTAQSSTEFVQANASAIQKILDDMFNK